MEQSNYSASLKDRNSKIWQIWMAETKGGKPERGTLTNTYQKIGKEVGLHSIVRVRDIIKDIIKSKNEHSKSV